jgi:hypothetical protein
MILLRPPESLASAIALSSCERAIAAELPGGVREDVMAIAVPHDAAILWAT